MSANLCKECGIAYPKTSAYNAYRLCGGCARARLLAPGQALGDPFATADAAPTKRTGAPTRIDAVVAKRAERLALVMHRKAAIHTPDSDRPVTNPLRLLKKT